MIRSDAATRPSASRPPDWQTVLARSVTEAAQLCRLLGLSGQLAEAAGEAARRFKLVVPRPFLARITPGDPADPLLRQILPTAEELLPAAGFSEDPLGEAAASPLPGLLTKYQGRSLIVATRLCGVHCRFCFRRHQTEQPGEGESRHLEDAIARAAADPRLAEVILSGGDPLMLDDPRLARIAGQIAAIPQVRRLRVHTRLPVLIPQRVTPSLVAALRSTRLTVVLVLHVNHAAEIDEPAAAAIARLADAGIPLLSQSVLLRGVNDNVDALVQLFERLVDNRVMPYYLHQLDRVAGAAHFEVPEAVGAQLIQAARTRLPGYAVPRYVRDMPGSPNKRPLI
ncbi:MAG: EF-P beta-lysylation protein EpmB [Pirellulales bacterium]|jgi:EF-P beta-lysylation protein EpmB|nr:EF-P beta-lysylation protein EpmB [Thermoguttaceae bacterium]MDD4788449.1 EF-P beta-lysylation protein EpmB [Pirellulales bacterium]MDI9442694.1 EF-P beta-lysylation protein EpmB [Planctomycetota bacterium]NLZ02646.1 EF-P beta-lysylation protein EpmB [Pirellulaceae bacterium]